MLIFTCTHHIKSLFVLFSNVKRVADMNLFPSYQQCQPKSLLVYGRNTCSGALYTCSTGTLLLIKKKKENSVYKKQGTTIVSSFGGPVQSYFRHDGNTHFFFYIVEIQSSQSVIFVLLNLTKISLKCTYNQTTLLNYSTSAIK